MWSCNLPQDVSFNIFSRLPVKSLMRCKCVCKTWCTLVAHPHLINMHLHSLSSQFNDPDVMVVTYDCSTDLYHISMKWSLYVVENVSSCENVSIKPLPLFLDHSVRAIGSCDGLICLTNYSLKPITLQVCNPFTGESTELPSSTRVFSEVFFGYNSMLSEYEVLGIVCMEGHGAEAEVYTLGSSSWRRIGGVPFDHFGGQQQNVYLDGNLYWMAFDSGDSSIVGVGSFDIAAEKFRFTPLPPELIPAEEEDDYPKLNISVLGTSVCLVDYSSHECVEIWEMKQSGIKVSWTKSYMLSVPEYVESMNVLGLLKSGEILLSYNSDKLVSFNPYTRKVRYLGINAHIGCAFVHAGTLVSPLRGGGVQ